MVDGHNACDIEWPAAGRTKQPGNLRADRHAVDHRRNPNARERNLNEP